jgi:hypothetical protein
MKKWISVFVAFCLFSFPAFAGGPNTERVITEVITLETDGTAVFTWNYTNRRYQYAHFRVVTTNRTNAAVLDMKVLGVTDGGTYVVCDAADLSSNSSINWAIGTGAGATQGITSACDVRLPRRIRVVLTVSVATGTFDVESSIILMSD